LQPSGASWISSLPQLNGTEIDYIDSFYRARLQALQAVDELVDVITDRLEQYNLTENTYIIYTSDNGFHMGQHRMQPGKSCAFEEDVNVPFFIRGPGIPKNRTVEFMTSHTDITPTLFQLAGIQLRDDFDGTPMPVTEWAMDMAKSSPLHDHVAIEYWGDAIGEGAFASTGLNGSYCKSSDRTHRWINLTSSI
jgi:N-acetylglucosamine-6-sulfatase